MSTAETLPKGAVVFTDTELLLLGASIGVTDNLQLSLGATVPLGDAMLFNASAKLRLLKVDRFRLALTGSGWMATSNNDNAYLLTGGPVASVCIDQACNSLVSGQVVAMSQNLTSDSGSPRRTSVGYAASALLAVTEHAKFLLELDSATHFSGSDSGLSDNTVFDYALRLYGGRFAADIGFIKPLRDTGSSFPLGLPFLNFSYRVN